MFLEITRNIDPITNLIGDWLCELNIASIIIRLTIAVLFGGLIGVERAGKNHAAGFRTYILVTIGATVVMLTNQYIYESFKTGDVARLGAQVISGIGFLGAGTIIVTSRNQIKGLTTAAGLWACACVGLSIGVGFYTVSIIGIFIIIISMTLFSKFEHYFTNKSKMFKIHLELESRPYLRDFTAYSREIGLKVKSLDHNTAYSGAGLSVYTVIFEFVDKKNKTSHKDVIELFKKLEYINYVEEIY